MTNPTPAPIRPFTIQIPPDALDDLRARLATTRYPAAAPGDAWTYGTPVAYLRDMVARWLEFDWRAQESRLNAVPQFLTEIDGQTIHFVHVRSAEAGATPLLLLHTYPGSFIEFLEMVGRWSTRWRTVAARRTRSTSSCRRCPESASARP